ncbi:MAG: 30S ribosomal protein S12 methylthiotransferase RimO [Actinobacteria bacterium]|nr:30S ribosomal protein S12 methylthiotransferase RimO [Actinomycetota bacterium]
MPPPPTPADQTATDPRSVAVVTLGCARNEVDSEELAGRLAGAGWRLVPEPGEAAVVLVNTCGFIESAKKDSIDTLLAAADTGSRVVAVGCLAERYGDQLAASLPEADAVLGFDDYPQIDSRLADVLAGRPTRPHQPRDRRALLPISPVDRSAAAVSVAVPGHGPRVLRRRLEESPVAPLKLASGCDRRCAFCAIPSFRGAFVSRPPAEVLAEARWLVEQGVRELVLVSENTTSYGKDLGDLTLLEQLLPELAKVDGVEWVRLSYLQPAELRPRLIETLCDTDRVVPYFDLSFQHASEPVLRRMRRFGSPARFLDQLQRIRDMRPDAGVRSNVIVGFPGETDDDVAELERFLTDARLDVVGVFGYSDEEGTEAAGYDGKVPAEVVAERVGRLTGLVEELTAQRAEDRVRVRERLQVLVESVRPAGDGAGGLIVDGRAAHQAPEVDGATTVLGVPAARVGSIVPARATGSSGVDLTAAYAG